MLVHHWLFPKLCVTVALVLFTTSSLAIAAHSSEGSRPLYAGNRFVPIGKLYSLGAVMIDGRTFSGEQMLWGGEQIWAKEASANVHLDDAGQVLLYKGSIARLATTAPTRGAIEIDSALSVFVSTGEIAVSLEPDFIAHITIGDDVFRASRGSKFKVRTADDESTFEMSLGEISLQGQRSKGRYRVVGAKRDDRQGIWTESKQKVIKAKPGELKPVGVFVTPPLVSGISAPKDGLLLVGYQAGSTDQSPRGIDVLFCLPDTTVGSIKAGGSTAGSTAGSSCKSALTGTSGLAYVNFQAGDNEGQTILTATVVRSPQDSVAWTIVVKKAPPPWRLRNVLIFAAAMGIVCAFTCHPNRGPLRQVPPPVIP